MKKLLFSTIAGLVLMASAASAAECVIDLDHYRLIGDGMTRVNVERVMGCEATSVSRFETNGVETVTLSFSKPWVFEFIMVSLTNDHVTFKSTMGLD